MTSKYIEAAQRYVRNVLSGAVPACKWTRLAVERQRDDLARAPSSSWPYVFDHARASRPCEFIELLPHIKGKWAREGRLIELEDWQCFIITTVFGWIHKKVDPKTQVETWVRRYREGYVEVPRKNAKSTLSSGLALYMLSADGEHGAEVYSAATTRDQARIVFDDSRAMAERVSDLRTYLGVAFMQHSITVAHTASKYTPLAAEGSTLDGLNVHFAVIDELHAHKTRAVYDVIDSARGSREQSLLWNITTAGTDIGGICYERRTHTVKVLEHVIDDPALFGIIYTIDSADDPYAPSSWAKANPNYGHSVLEDDMAAAARKAKAMPSALNNFLTKRLNVWVNGESAWMDMRAWEERTRPGISLEAIPRDVPVWLGLDLAEKVDFAALVAVYQMNGCWHVCPRLYLNEVAVAASTNAYLSGWVHQGHVEVTDGNITDFDVIASDIRELCGRLNVQEVAYDPALSRYFARQLLDEGLPLVEITQRGMFFTGPLIEVENLVHEERLVHDGNPVMNWMMSNLVVKVSKFNELRAPTKERPENKIDGVLAMLMALGRALSIPVVDTKTQQAQAFWDSFAEETT